MDEELKKLTLVNLRKLAKEQGIAGAATMKKDELIIALSDGTKDDSKANAKTLGNQPEETKGKETQKTSKIKKESTNEKKTTNSGAAVKSAKEKSESIDDVATNEEEIIKKRKIDNKKTEDTKKAPKVIKEKSDGTKKTAKDIKAKAEEMNKISETENVKTEGEKVIPAVIKEKTEVTKKTTKEIKAITEETQKISETENVKTEEIKKSPEVIKEKINEKRAISADTVVRSDKDNPVSTSKVVSSDKANTVSADTVVRSNKESIINSGKVVKSEEEISRQQSTFRRPFNRHQTDNNRQQETRIQQENRIQSENNGQQDNRYQQENRQQGNSRQQENRVQQENRPQENRYQQENRIQSENNGQQDNRYQQVNRQLENENDSENRNNLETNRQSENRTSPMDSGVTKEGILEVMADGFGFIRCDNFLPGENDVYVSPTQIRRMNMKTGDYVVGNTKVRSQGEKFGALLYVKSINGYHPAEAIKRKKFEDLTPIFPNQRLHLETPGCGVAMRMVDIISPIGKGQRGMIVSQPKAGKTTLLKQIARSIKMNHPDMHLIILLIDERPEEVTDMKESIMGDNVEVIYSTFDELPDNHKRVSEMVIERAKRLVEHGKDVAILLDSITRLARAYNLTCTTSGRTLSGGLDPAALHMPKRFFGAARNMREGGSLTILATALVETGSRMDDVVFEEFKGTGNMELVLDRSLSERRIFPAIDLPKSSTRREDLLLTQSEMEANFLMRRAINSVRQDDAVERIINMFMQTKSNAEFINLIKRTKILI